MMAGPKNPEQLRGALNQLRKLSPKMDSGSSPLNAVKKTFQAPFVPEDRSSPLDPSHYPGLEDVVKRIIDNVDFGKEDFYRTLQDRPIFHRTNKDTSRIKSEGFDPGTYFSVDEPNWRGMYEFELQALDPSKFVPDVEHFQSYPSIRPLLKEMVSKRNFISNDAFEDLFDRDLLFGMLRLELDAMNDKSFSDISQGRWIRSTDRIPPEWIKKKDGK